MSFLRSVTRLVLAFCQVVQSVIMRIMGWCFYFFTSEEFLPRMGTLEDGTGRFYQMFYDAGTDTNVFNLLLSRVILPASIAIVIILVAFSLFRSMLSDKETESPGKSFLRAGISVVLIVASITIFGVLLRAGNFVQVWAGDAIETYAGNIGDSTFENISAKAGEILGNRSSYSEEEIQMARETLDTWSNGYWMYLASGGDQTVTIMDWLATPDASGGTLADIWPFHDLNNDGTLSEADKDMAESIIHTATVEEVQGNVYLIGVSILSSILALVLTWKYIKLLTLYLSRYVRTGMLVIFSPLASAAYASATTAEIYTAYVRMYIASLVSLVITQAFILAMKLACSITLNANTLTLMILYYCLTLAFIEFTESADSYINRTKLGIPDRTREGSLGGLGVAAVRLMGMDGGNMFGKIFGGAAHAALHPLEALQTMSGNILGKGAEWTQRTGAATGTMADGAGNGMLQSAGLVSQVTMSNIPAGHRETVQKAIQTALGMASATVTGHGLGNGIRASQRSNGKYGVEQYAGTAQSVLEAVQGQNENHITSASVIGENGSVYQIEKGINRLGREVFKIQDTANGVPINTGNIHSWEDALKTVENAAGGITGDSEFASDDGYIYRTYAGESDVMKQEGEYESWEQALGRMDGCSSYSIENEAGYHAHVSGLDHAAEALLDAESIDVYGKDEDGNVVRATMDSTGKVHVHDKHNYLAPNATYSGMDSFQKDRNIERVTFSPGRGREEERNRRKDKIFKN